MVSCVPSNTNNFPADLFNPYSRYYHSKSGLSKE